MTTSTLGVALRAPREDFAPIEIKFSKQRMPGEPELKLMLSVEELIGALVGASTKPMLPLRHRSLMGSKQELETVSNYLSNIVMQAAALFERDGAGWQPVERSPYYALYVFGMFRFGLSIKDLSALSSRLVEEGHLQARAIRALHKQATRAHSSLQVSTPLADLGLDSRYWR